MRKEATTFGRILGHLCLDGVAPVIVSNAAMVCVEMTVHVQTVSVPETTDGWPRMDATA